MTAFVRYDVERTEFAEIPYTDSAPGRRVVFTITSTAELPDDAVFVFKAIPAANGQLDDAVFSHVASITDMENYPVGTPDEGDVWFRAETLDLVVETDDLVDEILELVKADLKFLSEAADALLSLQNPSSEIAPSEETETTPGGSQAGEDATTLRINFPVPLDVAPIGRVLVAISPSISFKVTNVDTAGFDLASNVTISSSHIVRWQVVV